MRFLHKAILICFAWLSVAAMPATAQETASATRFDGVYEITVNRTWRNEYWRHLDNPNYVPGKLELLHSARVEIINGEVIFAGLTKTVPTAGPAFDNFSGALSDGGALAFSAGINLLRGAGKVAPYDMTVAVQLRPSSRYDQAFSAKPEGFSKEWDVLVTVTSVGRPDNAFNNGAQGGNS
ncbi:hypothetical protein [Roseobacter ponti]|uniref:Uncharacterized protein n=1 Tax=Roseobacter ponti TaxID=1891787 RepID=A0A858SVT1_9RHOB|nr:hypothetical protein [Roseobacter ponti]QJF51932.1 hypothetical protein G3256_12520 [Roseobacter ponti]